MRRFKSHPKLHLISQASRGIENRTPIIVGINLWSVPIMKPLKTASVIPELLSPG
jgi:hypothetical protein